MISAFISRYGLHRLYGGHANEEKQMRALWVATALLIGSASFLPASAGQAVPETMARHLDQAPADFTMTAAKQRRLYMIEQGMRQQQLQQRRAQGYGRGPGYGPGPGRGYGYGPRPGYGPRAYGPPPGYGYPRGYSRGYGY